MGKAQHIPRGTQWKKAVIKLTINNGRGKFTMLFHQSQVDLWFCHDYTEKNQELLYVVSHAEVLAKESTVLQETVSETCSRLTGEWVSDLVIIWGLNSGRSALIWGLTAHWGITQIIIWLQLSLSAPLHNVQSEPLDRWTVCHRLDIFSHRLT